MSETIILAGMVCVTVFLSVFFAVGFWAVVQLKKMEKRNGNDLR